MSRAVVLGDTAARLVVVDGHGGARAAATGSQRAAQARWGSEQGREKKIRASFLYATRRSYPPRLCSDTEVERVRQQRQWRHGRPGGNSREKEDEGGRGPGLLDGWEKCPGRLLVIFTFVL